MNMLQHLFGRCVGARCAPPAENAPRPKRRNATIHGLIPLRWVGLALLLGASAANASYLGLDGGLEGSATVDNSTTYTAAQSGKWTKNNSTTTIELETTYKRSGSNALRVRNASTTGRRIWSPLFSFSSETTGVTIQYYRMITNTVSAASNQVGVIRATESLQAAYNRPSSANSWEKKTYSPASATFSSIAGVLMTRGPTAAGGNIYIDDMCIYPGGIDTTAPNSASAVVITTNSSTSLGVSWTAASGGVDGGGYLVVRYTSSPAAGDDPNANGIYATNNTLVGTVTGTVVYQGDGTSFTDSGLTTSQTYYYKVYTYDKAYNYAVEVSGSGTPTGGGVLVVLAQVGRSGGADLHILPGGQSGLSV